jgi:hypothetical protein
VSRARGALVTAALVVLACGGDGADAGPAEVCAAVSEWQAAMAEATNDFTRTSRETTEPDERREAYLGAFGELQSLTRDLADAIADRDPAVRDALAIAEGLLAEARTEAEALGDDAYEVRRVPGGSLFTASERSRATVLSAARPTC